MNNRMTNEFNQFTETAYNTGRNEKPVYKNFAASKMSQAVKPQSIVEFTDFMGRKHRVAVKNNTELKKQMAFFAMLKKESLTISQIISEYPISKGKIVKKYLPQLRKELKETLSLTKKQIDLILA